MTIKTKHIAPPSHFKQALREFNNLPGVNKDLRGKTTVDDLVAAARKTVVTWIDGDMDLTLAQVKRIGQFVTKYGKEK